MGGSAGVLKAVTGASSLTDCELIHAVGREVVSDAAPAYIGVCLGAAGSESRVLNRRFTPVCHPCMAAAAPGQLSAEELMNKRLASGLINPKKFFLLGKPIQQSLSPSMHNAAYKALLLPHHYGLNEQDTVGSYAALFKSSEFGGASVTIPHKETIIELLDEGGHFCGGTLRLIICFHVSLQI